MEKNSNGEGKKKLIKYLSARLRDYTTDHRSNRKCHWFNMIFSRLAKKEYLIKYLSKQMIQKLNVKTLNFSHVAGIGSFISRGPLPPRKNSLAPGVREEGSDLQ